MRVPAQYLCQQRSLAAADVNDAANVREVVGVGHAGRVRRSAFGHGSVEDGSPIGILADELEQAHSKRDVDPWRPGLDRLEDVLVGLDAADQQGGPRPHACRGVAAQAVAEHGQAEGSGLNLVEHAERGEEAKDAVERGLVGTGDPG